MLDSDIKYTSPIQGWRYITCNDVLELRENERVCCCLGGGVRK